MSVLSGARDFFGLDIGTSAIRLVQLRGGGPVKALVKYALVPIDTKVVLSDAKADQQKVANTIKDLIAQTRLSTKNVVAGLPSQKVFCTVADIDKLSKSELDKTIRYQADTLIPTPVAESKIDWVYLGDSPKDPKKVEILLASAPNDFIEQRLDMLEGIGLNVLAFEPDSIALARAIIPADATTPQLVLDMGVHSSDLVISANGGPKLMRSIPTGSESVLKAAMQNLNIDEKQAEQFVYKFGLSQSKLEGQVYNAIIGTVETLVAEIEKSIKFYQSRYTGQLLDRIIVTGGASSLPEFPLYLANKFTINVEIGNSWRNVTYPQDRQNELLAVSSHFAVAAGLAERVE
ncbi:type IV pilus assembly protein PilM [Candidatus Saccharibacteria bacterium]|jgi:type IV pilus assembly protein PilM|nr:type IV pilus assembly protein PilM [Candidatus Saccharibacteria bacterium]HPW48072.1 type IV pilus assembly protein PilM [Candidatus Saccharibacteria bacterium]